MAQIREGFPEIQCAFRRTDREETGNHLANRSLTDVHRINLRRQRCPFTGHARVFGRINREFMRV